MPYYSALFILFFIKFCNPFISTGHVCLTDNDKDNARNNKGSLLYGELLPRGANKVRHSSFSDTTYLAVM